MRRFVLLLAIMIGGSLAAAPRKPLYTEEQARAGAEIYSQRCAMCHGKALEGTFEVPTLQGRFVAHWNDASVGELYSYIARAMPQFSPGSLTPDETAKLVAFLLQENGQPAGSDPLPSDAAALREVRLGKQGSR